MHNKLFTIGEIARLKGITIKALRFYDKIGLLTPYHIDPQTQYRYYHIDQFVLLDIIKAARSMDISPMDLVTLFREKDTNKLMALIRLHRDHMEQKIKQLRLAIDGMDHVAETVAMAQKDQSKEQVFEKSLPERIIKTVPYRADQTSEEYILDYAALATNVHTAGLTHTYESGVYLEHEQGILQPKALWTGITPKTATGACFCLPAGAYLCIVCTPSNAEEKFALLHAALIERKVQPSFLLQVELLTDVFQQSSLIEMQVPLFQGIPTIKQFPSPSAVTKTSHS